MKFDYIFIDIDDTLFDFSKAEEISLKNLLEGHNIKFTKEFLNEYRNHNLKLWQRIDTSANIPLSVFVPSLTAAVAP